MHTTNKPPPPMPIHAVLHPPIRLPPPSLSPPTATAMAYASKCGKLVMMRQLRRQYWSCKAIRRRVRYEEGEEEEEEAYGQNKEIPMLEAYSAAFRDVALLVRAGVDDEEELVLIFKGFSSSLSSRTSSDPSKSVLPGRAVIQSIDVVKGPFNPSNIEYLERGLTWEDFKTRLQPNKS
ncbi:uncharacterized protein LOC122025352 [Zingiber officinale]|uniref:uncharacterized protein LOC122025352 n=1 Tax=Zingiber officinale TaxID=94328 RepID=UPI001C4D7CF5|nr:uncharacterized protein LOC122025352 [Zingiber officinale]